MNVPGGWRPLFYHLKKYLTVGVGSTATDLSVLLVLTGAFGWPAHVANLVSRPCGGLFSFAFNKIWTFGHAGVRGTGGQLARFWTTWCAAYAASEVLIWALTRKAGWHALPSKIAAEAVINAAVFLTHRHWTFRKQWYLSRHEHR